MKVTEKNDLPLRSLMLQNQLFDLVCLFFSGALNPLRCHLFSEKNIS